MSDCDPRRRGGTESPDFCFLRASASPWFTIKITAIAAIAAACTREAGTPLGVAQRDTLPGGVVVVHSPAPTGWHDTLGWRLVPDGRVGGGLDEPGELVNPQSLALDDAGNLYVSDQQPSIIKMFAPDGRFVRTIGREGQGPGEFVVGFIAAREGHLAVQDPRTSRVSLFDTAGTFIRSWSTSCCIWAPIHLDRRHRVYVPVMTPPGVPASYRYVRYDTLGVVIDTVAVPKGEDPPMWTVRQGNVMQMMTPVPFTPQMRHAVAPDGSLIFGWSGEYRLVRTEGRDTLGVMSRDWTPDPLSQERRQRHVDGMIERMGEGLDEVALRNSFPVGEIPSTLPAFVEMNVDGAGNIWLTADSDSASARLDVFSPEGAWLGRVVVPESFDPFTPSAWGTDRVYVSRQDEDGVPYVARYRIERSLK